MTKSKKFWAAMAMLSLAVMVYSAWSIYGRINQHFSGDTIEVRPVPMPPPSEEPGADTPKETDEEKPQQEAGTDQEEEAKAGKPAPAQPAAKPEEGGKAKAVRTTFEYKDAAAKSVRIAGTFTSWKEKSLSKKDGVWKTDIYILPGTYPYHFIVNGKTKADPAKPKTPGGDSLVTVQ